MNWKEEEKALLLDPLLYNINLLMLEVHIFSFSLVTVSITIQNLWLLSI